jgi:hypothetical protein
MYLQSNKLAPVAMCLRRVRVAGHTFTPGAPPLAHVSTRLRHKTSAMGLRRRHRGQARGGMLEEMSRIDSARPVTPRSGSQSIRTSDMQAVYPMQFPARTTMNTKISITADAERNERK